MQYKTFHLIADAKDILREDHPMTVRQVFYQLVSKGTLPNTRGSYQTVSRVLNIARQEGRIPWEWVEDRLRRPRHYQSHEGLSKFLGAVRYGYLRDVWRDQPEYVECWLEKDALSGMFDATMYEFRVWLNVSRGYASVSAIHDAAVRYRRHLAEGRQTTLLYFGDFDASGEDIPRALEDELNNQGVFPTLIKVALTADDVAHYSLPPNLTKKTDSRAKDFIEKYGEKSSVELDALPARVLKQRIHDELSYHMEMDALRATLAKEADEDGQLAALIQLAKDDKLLARMLRLAPWIARLNGDDLNALYLNDGALVDIVRDHDDEAQDSQPFYVGEHLEDWVDDADDGDDE